jgi:hypothetical protein
MVNFQICCVWPLLLSSRLHEKKNGAELEEQVLGLAVAEDNLF